jgi:hypothetical protein
MARVRPGRHEELEAFWRFHHDAWSRGRLNQREYSELHDLPLKRFGNWRAQFKVETKVRKSGLLYRRGGLGHMASQMTSHMPDRDIGLMSPGYNPSARAMPDGRRSFSLADKNHLFPGSDGGGKRWVAMSSNQTASARRPPPWQTA